MIRAISLGLLLFFVGNTAFTQAKLGFTNLNGFPDVILNGNKYNLQGYVVNRGNTPSPAIVSIMMSINGGSAVEISRNYNLGSPIAPGDSAFWIQTEYIFNANAMVPGHNDIVIWPTAPVGTSDLIGKQVFFINNTAGFRMGRDDVKNFQAHLQTGNTYSLRLHTVNVGQAINHLPVKFYLRFDDEAPIYLGKTPTANHFSPGDTVKIDIHNFNLMQLYQTYYSGASSLQPLRTVSFLACETRQVVAVSEAVFDMGGQASVGLINGQNGPVRKLTTYPVPARNEVFIAQDGLPVDDVKDVALYNQIGQVVWQSQEIPGKINISQLPSGRYFLQVRTTASTWAGSVVKE